MLPAHVQKKAVVYRKCRIQYTSGGRGTRYLHHLQCMTEIQPALAERRERKEKKKKNRSAYCATVWHRDGCEPGHASNYVQKKKKKCKKLHFAILTYMHAAHVCFFLFGEYLLSSHLKSNLFMQKAATSRSVCAQSMQITKKDK